MRWHGVFFAVLAWVVVAGANTQPAAGAALDDMIGDEGIWGVGADEFAEKWKGLGFRWTSAAKESSRTTQRGLAVCGMRVGETIVEFGEGKPKAIRMSLHNRGDDGAITDRVEFEKLVAEWGAALARWTGVRGEERGRDARSAVRADAMLWTKGGVDYVLEYSATGGARDFRSEFARLTVSPAASRSLIAQATEEKAVRPTAKADLPKNVVRKDGDVFIDGIPMVDQGQKGYCVNAASSRVFNYYGVGLTQHEVAQMADTTAEKGTSSDAMVEALKTIARRFKARLKVYLERDVSGWLKWIEDYNKAAKKAKGKEMRVGHMIDVAELYATADPELLKAAFAGGSDGDRFRREVRESVDAGIPMLWTLQVGIFPEQGSERLQGTGGHMRLIIGYNQKSDEVIFSDSWGRGHELKRMKFADAIAATTGLFAILPIR